MDSDPDALGRLVDYYRPRLRRMREPLAGSAAACPCGASDVVQEVCLLRLKKILLADPELGGISR